MKWNALVLILSLLGVAGAGANEPAAALQNLMKGEAQPLSDRLWEIAGRATNDDGEPDASKLNDADWQALIGAARALKATAERMTDPARLAITEPGGTLGDGAASGATAEMVRGFIAANPDLFAANARALGLAADTFIAAAEKKDAAGLMKASDNLAVPCETCHAKFWYPQ